MAGALFRPLTPRWRMQKLWTDGSRMDELAGTFIKPNDRLSSFERLEIYNRQYWFRILDCLWDDFPGLRAIVGKRKFMKLITAYLARYQSNSYTPRDLGNRLEQFLREEPHWAAPREELALDMVQFEWAQVVAFDGPSKPPISPDEILDRSAATLQLGLQPYLSLLELNYAVDDFLIAVKKQESDVLRGEASNAVGAAPRGRDQRKRSRRPKREKVYLAVHRHDNILYYKRLDPEAYAILTALSRGETVEDACADAVPESSQTKIDWADQIQRWFDDWSVLGWFCRPPSLPRSVSRQASRLIDIGLKRSEFPRPLTDV
jgi:hypothetical protein